MSVIPALAALSLFFIFALAGCTAQRSVALTEPPVPAQWPQVENTRPVDMRWLAALNTPQVEAITRRAIASNHALAQQAAQVEVARQQVILSGADRWPALSIGGGGQRGRATAVSAVRESYDIGIFAAFELDLWGKLSDSQRQAQLQFAAQELSYRRAERTLVVRTVREAFDLITAERLQALFDQRLANLEQSLDVIERGYRSGLNGSLDVYLAQTTVEQERANIANQQQIRFEASTTLQQILSLYPDAQLRVDDELPGYPAFDALGVPSELLQRRSDVQQLWLELLAADAQLAIAHKNKFPGLSFSANLRDSDDTLRRLLDGGQLAWSLAASLTQPLFQGGRLRASEHQAKARVQQAEHRYLQQVFQAFVEVENEMHRGSTLQRRLQAIEQANNNAQVALGLAFDQYQRGLVTYTTVLESQRRAFDAQTAVIQLQNQLAQSRVVLHLALGGGY